MFQDEFENRFKFNKLEYRIVKNNENKVTKIIENIPYEDLDKIDNLLGCNTDKFSNNVKIKQIWKKDINEKELESSIFLGRFIEKLFLTFYYINNNIKFDFPDVNNLINSNIIDLPHFFVEWYYKYRNYITWEIYDEMIKIPDQIDQKIIKLVDKYLPRCNKFESYTLLSNGFHKQFVITKKDFYKKLYNKYQKIKFNNISMKKIIKYVFNFVLLTYAIETHHYFHVQDGGSKFKYILKDYKELFNKIWKYAINIEYNFIE